MLRPMGPSLALDFLAMIDARERLPGGAFAILDEADRATLRELLRGYHEQGLTGALERRARTFLISYRELDKHAGVLDAAERERLGQILGEPPLAGQLLGQSPVSGQSAASPGRSTPWRWVSATGFAVLAAAGLGLGVAGHVSSHQAGPPAPVVQGQALPDQQSLPQGTGLQNLRQEYGPWRQLTRPAAGNLAVLLLQGGGAYVSQRWTVPAGAPGWTRPAASDVASARVDGDQVSITDADGGAWIVGVGQPFVFAGAPGTMLRIDRDGAVWSLSLAQATAARRSLGR
jgi:hypothetical protein